MILEVKPDPRDPLKVEFFAAGKRLDNVRSEKIWNDKGKLTVRAVVEYDPAREAQPKSVKRGAADEVPSEE